MAANTKIEWADHTFNPWIGCTKISPACDHCYAEGWAKRSGRVEWGRDRIRTRAGNWQQPHNWNRCAEREGARKRVFCASLADVFDNQVHERWRDDLWHLIDQTPHLDWLLLTKRPQNIAKMLPTEAIGCKPWGDGWPNVWLGTTVENQHEADRRIPYLLSVQARVRFLSCEPLLGPVNVTPWLRGCHECAQECGWRSGSPPDEEVCHHCGWIGTNAGEFCSSCGGQDFGGVCPRCEANVVHEHPDTPILHWIICGGESGHGARPMDPDWARSLRDQCVDNNVPFFMKQMAKKAPIPDDLAIRQFVS